MGRCVRPLALALFVLCSCSPGASERANVVIVSVDTLRRDHMGSYGYARDTTPELDRFFAAGTVFDEAWSPAPCTLPSVPQVLTSSYVVRPDRLSLAETLQSRGWRTAAIVSQHQFDPAWHARGDLGGLASAVARGFDSFDLQAPDELDAHRMTTRTARQVSDRALAWLTEYAEAGPFLLWLHYFDPHDPYQPPQAFREFDRGNGSKRSGDRRAQLKAERRDPQRPWQLAGEIFGTEDVAHLANLYDGEIRYADFEIGRVLRALEARRLVERSLVVFFSDHGEWLGEENRWDHCQTLQDVEIRVPFFWRVHGGRLGRGLGGGPRSDAPASTLDLLPTLLGLLGIEHHADAYDGADLRSVPGDRDIFADWVGFTAVRRERWKLIYGDGPVSLVDLEAGAAQRQQALGEGLPAERELSAAVEAFRRRHGIRSQSRQIFDQLRSLGYID